MKPEKNKIWNIRERVFAYALRAIKLYQALRKGNDGAGWEIGRQYLRSATSVGANIEEAQAAESRADFIHKYGLAQKEAKESRYWLRLLGESGILPKERLTSMVAETEELISIITAIIVKTKAKDRIQTK